MSPRRTPPQDAPRSTSPYGFQTRQASGSNKNKKREQFSACGACRMRRVRCDLKDLPGSGGQGIACSNCKERGLKCVDEFAEVKAVKLLRRGRRLQQAEAVYGKAPPELDALRSVTPPPSVIPRLAPEFFDSAFFARFQVQRPILEPLEYRARYVQFTQGNTDVLQIPGQLIALTLVVWATTFGVNEFGVEDPGENVVDIRQQKENINDMLQELLYLIDLHGILRKTSWDGVKLLLLLLPLTQDVQSPMDRLVMYEATLSQVYNLCNLVGSSPISSGQGEYIDALVRARLFWYAYVTDGVTSGLRGGRILLSDCDLEAFEATLPAHADGTPASEIYSFTFRCVSIPNRISSVCRTIHAALTGPMMRQTDRVKEDLLNKAWDGLDNCWTALDALKSAQHGNIIDIEDLERFIHGWQIFIFECHNIIREALKQKSRQAHGVIDDTRKRLTDLHDQAKNRCHVAARDVVAIIKQNLGSAFFQYDASLVRDGCFFAAFLLASESGTTDEIEACIQALQEMRWIYSRSDERVQTVRMVWHARVQTQNQLGTVPLGSVHDTSLSQVTGEGLAYGRRQPVRSMTIPPLTIPPGPSSRASSTPNTAITQSSSWSSSLSTGSSSRTHSYPTSTYSNSPITGRTPPYLGSPQMADSLLHASSSKNPIPGAAGTLLSGPSGLTLDRADDPTYFAYGYQGPIGEGSSHGLVPQQGISTASIVIPSYHQVPYQDPAIPYGGTSLDAAAEHHMLSPVDDEELVDPSGFF